MQNGLIQKVAAKVIIEAEGAILALYPSEIDLNRNWQMPGGIRDDMRERESLTETAVREVREETGVDISGMALKPVKIGEWTAVDHAQKVKILAVFFHIILPGQPDILLSEEHDDFAWLDKSNYQNYQSNPEVNEIIEQLL